MRLKIIQDRNAAAARASAGNASEKGLQPQDPRHSQTAGLMPTVDELRAEVGPSDQPRGTFATKLRKELRESRNPEFKKLEDLAPQRPPGGIIQAG